MFINRFARFTIDSVKLALYITRQNCEDIIGGIVLFIGAGWILNLCSIIPTPEPIKTIIFLPLRMSYRGWTLIFNITPIKWSIQGWSRFWYMVSS